MVEESRKDTSQQKRSVDRQEVSWLTRESIRCVLTVRLRLGGFNMSSGGLQVCILSQVYQCPLSRRAPCIRNRRVHDTIAPCRLVRMTLFP